MGEVRKPRITLPILVEGKYDKITLSSLFDARIIELSGFGIFNSKEKQSLIRKIGERGGIILLTDSDGGGCQIRSFISGLLPKEKIHNVYIPQIPGKERRKTSPSKAGYLGVEGMDRQTLEKLLAPFIDRGACEENDEKVESAKITKLDFYNDMLTGAKDSAARRDALATELGLPRAMSANALLEALNMLITRDEYAKIILKTKG